MVSINLYDDTLSSLSIFFYVHFKKNIIVVLNKQCFTNAKVLLQVAMTEMEIIQCPEYIYMHVV